jgi:uncharacterized protein (DUF305 family)
MSTTRQFAVVAIVLMSTFVRSQSAPDSHLHRIPATPDAGWSQLMVSMDKMHAEMAAVEPAGDSDSDFVRLMLPHHQAALDMVKTQLMYGKDPQLRRLAQEIITDQQSEIELMQLWLKQRRSSSPNRAEACTLHASKEH